MKSDVGPRAAPPNAGIEPQPDTRVDPGSPLAVASTWPGNVKLDQPTSDMTWRVATSWLDQGRSAAVLGVPETDLDFLWISCARGGGARFDLTGLNLPSHEVFDVRLRASDAVVATTGRTGPVDMDGNVIMSFVVFGDASFGSVATAPLAIAVRESGAAGRWSGVAAPPPDGDAAHLIAGCLSG